MIFEILVSCFFIFTLYKFVWKPWRLQKWYVQQFKAKGYRVLEIPFRPFQVGFLKIYDLSENTKDSFKWCKDHYPNYDVVVTTILSSVFLDFIHPQLQKQILSSDSLDAFPK